MGVAAVFFLATMFVVACNGPHNPKPDARPEEKKPGAQQILKANDFPKAPAGTTYTDYKITWTDAQGKKQERTVTADEIKNGFVLPGGIQPGTKPKITPRVKNADGTITEKPDAATEPNPSTSIDWKLPIQAGIDELSKDKPDFDAALAKFKEAYDAEQNNTTKAYYAVVQLATISVKPAAVSFMRDRMGFASYPEKLNALINLEWFKEETKSRTETHTRKIDIHSNSFKQNNYGAYQRIAGHIADTADSSKVSIRINGGIARFEIGTFGPLSGKWVQLGYDALCKKIANTQPKDRKLYYNSDDLPYTGKYLIVDAFDAAGTFMVPWSDVKDMPGYNTAQKYQQDSHEWISYEYQYEKIYTYKEFFPEMKAAAEWYKDFDPLLQIPAYIIEHSNSANVNQLIDELYSIVFGDEFTNASKLLNSLDASKPVTIDQRLIKVLHLNGNVFADGMDAQVQKDQLLGLIGGLTVAKGGFELIQSYSFNTDLNILKWHWEKNADDALKNLGSYNQAQDPFNNGFLTGRNPSKITDAKADMVKGADMLLAAYKSLTDADTLPSKAKEELRKNTDSIRAIVQEIRNAIATGRKANLLIGENNPLKEGLARYPYQPGQPTPPAPIPMTTFEINMGKIFSYEYFKLSNLFAMNGSKPRIYPADGTHGSPYMKLTLKSFMNDFVTMKWADGTEGLDDEEIPLGGAYGSRILNFYK